MRRDNKPKGFDVVRPALSEKKLQSVIEFHYPDGRYFVFSSGTSLSLMKDLVSLRMKLRILNNYDY